MITRLVKMTFKPDHVEEFKVFFQGARSTILSFPGCEHLDLLQDIHRENVFFTYSLWRSEDDLNHYRESDFFKTTWSRASSWFTAPARAWSLDKLT